MWGFSFLVAIWVWFCSATPDVTLCHLSVLKSVLSPDHFKWWSTELPAVGAIQVWRARVREVNFGLVFHSLGLPHVTFSSRKCWIRSPLGSQYSRSINYFSCRLSTRNSLILLLYHLPLASWVCNSTGFDDRQCRCVCVWYRHSNYTFCGSLTSDRFFHISPVCLGPDFPVLFPLYCFWGIFDPSKRHWRH